MVAYVSMSVLMMACSTPQSEVAGVEPESEATTAARDESGSLPTFGISDARLVSSELRPAYVAPQFDWRTEVYAGDGFRLLVAIGPPVDGADAVYYSEVERTDIEWTDQQVVAGGVLSGREVTIGMYGPAASTASLERLLAGLRVEPSVDAASLTFGVSSPPSFLAALAPGSGTSSTQGASVERVYLTAQGRELVVLSQPVESTLPLELLAGAYPGSALMVHGGDFSVVAVRPPSSDMGWSGSTILSDTLVTVRGAADAAELRWALASLVALPDGGEGEVRALQESMRDLPLVSSGEVSEMTVEYRGPDQRDRMALCAVADEVASCGWASILSVFALVEVGGDVALVGVWPAEGTQPKVEFGGDVQIEASAFGDYIVNLVRVAGGARSMSVCITVEAVPPHCHDLVVRRS